MMKKSLLALILIFCMLPVTCFAAFPDLPEDHWAAESINAMVDLGLIAGYPDGTFGPSTAVTKQDSLILGARILGAVEEENRKYVDAAAAEYAATLSNYDIYSAREVSYLLNLGVLTLRELDSYIGSNVKGTPLTRAEAAVLITKLMGKEDEALSNTVFVLNYTDANEISDEDTPYIDFVSKQGIMQGMDDNTFAPNGEITRAQMATIMLRIYEKLELDYVNVILISAADYTFKATYNNKEVEYEIPDNTVVKLNNEVIPLNQLPTGSDLHIIFQNGLIRFIETYTTDLQESFSGTIASISNIGGIRSLSLNVGGTTDKYYLSENCAIKIDGAVGSFAELKNGYYVTVVKKGDELISVTTSASSSTVKGTIQGINVTAGTIDVLLNDNTENTYTISEDTRITRDGATEEFRLLAVGDKVTLDLQYGLIRVLTATSSTKQVNGTIEEIVISDSPSVGMTVGGVFKSYDINSNTVFLVDDEEATIYELRLGATAKLTLSSNSIEKISIESVVLPEQYTGKITAVHPTNRVIELVDENGDTQTIVVRSNCTFVDNTTTRVNDLSKLETGRTVIVLGNVNYGMFEATTLIITK